MTREIVLDTETTGFEPREGHRLVEIGCVELINHLPTGKIFHKYLNPERDVPADAFRVHGLSNEFLADKPLFAEIVDEFLAFVKDSPLVIHNAAFDMKFINAELSAQKKPIIPFERAVDTLNIARRKFPGSPASLDALCKRFGVDNSNREKHGALLDAELLAEVYLQLVGGRQQGLSLSNVLERPASNDVLDIPKGPFRPARPHQPNDEELAAHAVFIKNIKDALWNRAGSA